MVKESKDTDDSSVDRQDNVIDKSGGAHVLVRQIVNLANTGIPRVDFIREVSRLLMTFSGCDVVEFWLDRDQVYRRFVSGSSPRGSFHYDTRPYRLRDLDRQDDRQLTRLEQLAREVILGRLDSDSQHSTDGGSFWTGEFDESSLDLGGRLKEAKRSDESEEHSSIAIIPLVCVRENIGLLVLKRTEKGYFDSDKVKSYELMARDLGFALVNQRAQAALRERVKELTCLYGVAHMAAAPDITLDQLLKGLAELLPPGWQYPEITVGRIVFDGKEYVTSAFSSENQKQVAAIVVNGEKRGAIEVMYVEDMPELDEGPFLKEERSLIDTLAREVALIVEQKQAEEERARLQVQLMHADRLATIGQLAAGVAHELNEPIGNILGFAQLGQKHPDVSKPVYDDLDRIVGASLHAREIVRKLLLFSRQTPPKKVMVSLNDLINNGLYFLESRCAKAGIELSRNLTEDLPVFVADPSQLHQVLVNLVVNGIQAMPGGGKMTISTCLESGWVRFSVTDTGEGMDETIVKRIFIPFFTTKDVNEGTGLGLAVVHGIITAHGGRIDVTSKKGEGTQFDVWLPVTGNEENVNEE